MNLSVQRQSDPTTPSIEAVNVNRSPTTDPTARAVAGLRWSSALTLTAAVGPVVAQLAQHPEQLHRTGAQVALAASAMFALVLWTRLATRWPGIVLLAALATAAVAGMPFTLPNAPTLVLLQVMVAARLAHVGSRPLAWTVLVAQLAALIPIYRQIIGDGPIFLFAFVGSIGGLLLFAYHAARLHAREAATNAELRRTLGTLAVARAVLATEERLGERVRIARDLHDAVGHHLTTLSLQLDLARRQPPEDARATLDTAHSICRLLLTELRDVLQDMRRTDGPELAAALRGMIAKVPDLDVRLETDGDLGAIDPDRAHTLLRCAQEFLTNTLRHADAHSLALRLSVQGQGSQRRVLLRGADDGQGLRPGRPGGGLAGMEARLVAMGGALRTVERTDQTGLCLEAEIPLPEATP